MHDISDEEWPALDPNGDSQALPSWLAQMPRTDTDQATPAQNPEALGSQPPNNPTIPPMPRFGVASPFESSGFTSQPDTSIPSRAIVPGARPVPLGSNQSSPWVPAVPPAPPVPNNLPINGEVSGIFRAGPLAVRSQNSGSRPLPPAILQAELLTPGTVLKGGRYRIIQRFAPTYTVSLTDREPPLMMASDTELPGERVLIQEILLSSARPEDTEQVRQLIVQRLLGLARVPGVARLLDSFSERRRHFLIFELPTGDRLLDRMQRAHGPLPETDVIGYALQVLDILQALRRSQPQFVHGAITPANIILRPSGQVTLVGFSPALLVAAHSRGAQIPSGIGDPYAAPEQIRGQADHRSDLYALCAVMHHAVTGTPPSTRSAGIFEPARHLNPSVSLELEEVLSAGLRPSPSQRFQTAAALRGLLEPLASGRRLTHVPEDLREDASNASAGGGVLLRNARGQLVLPRQRLTQNPLFIVTIVLLLVVVIGGGVFYALTPHGRSSTATVQPTVDTSAALYQSKSIGLSGGEFVFDTQRPDNNDKARGARAVAGQDFTTALAAYEDAMKTDPADAEAAIYAQDLQILIARQPYVTVVAAVAFGSDDDGDSGDSEDSDSARSELQGIFLAQQRINTFGQMANNLRIRVLILNSGRDANDAKTATQLVVNEMNMGNPEHFIGIVGWPESAQTQLVTTMLSSTQLAIISPTASLDGNGGAFSYLFQLVPTDSQQGELLADAAVSQLQARRILIVADPKDAPSTALADNFQSRIVTAHPQADIVERIPFTVGKSTDFKDIADEALLKQSDLVLIAGNHRDAILLAQSLQAEAGPFRTPPHVLVGPTTDLPAFAGLGNDPGAVAARKDPSALSLLYMATYADMGEWQQVGVANIAITSFPDSYRAQFGSGAAPGGLDDPDAVAILSEDALTLLSTASSDGLRADTTSQYPNPVATRSRLLQFTSSKPFAGFGGAIAFTQTGHQVNKALGILQITPVTDATSNEPVGMFHVFAVTGGKAAFCGKSSCNPQW